MLRSAEAQPLFYRFVLLDSLCVQWTGGFTLRVVDIDSLKVALSRLGEEELDEGKKGLGWGLGGGGMRVSRGRAGAKYHGYGCSSSCL